MFVKHFIAISLALTVAYAVYGGTPSCGPPGGCSCNCNCNGGSNGTSAPPGTVYCQPCVGNGTGNGNMTGSDMLCENLIRSISGLNPTLGSLIAALLTTLLGNLGNIIAIVLAANNTTEGAVVPLALILCALVGIILLILKALTLLGIAGLGGLLTNILGPAVGNLLSTVLTGMGLGDVGQSPLGLLGGLLGG